MFDVFLDVLIFLFFASPIFVVPTMVGKIVRENKEKAAKENNPAAKNKE